MKRMSCLEWLLKVLQSASDLDQILLRRGRTDLTLRRPILLMLNFCHGLVDHPNTHIHSFIHSAISIAPLQVFYYSEALPTTARILYRSFTPKRTGNCR